MDPFSHGFTGALLAQSTARSSQLRTALLAGAVGAILVDLDILIQSPDDPLLNLDFHRHFTHSLVFIPIGGLIAALLLWPLLIRPRWHRGWLEPLSFWRLYLFALLGCATAGLLDAATSYGTHLLWPFSGHRTAWNIIAVVDPVYTVIVMACALLAVRYKRPAFARLGLVLALLYLGLGWVQRERAADALHELAAARSEIVERSLVKPTMANLLLWRGVYQTGDTYRVDAYRPGWRSLRIYEGDSHAVTDVGRDFPELPADSPLLRDLRRFSAFSDDYLILTQSPNNPAQLTVGDIRFALLPHSATPLWGMEIDPQRPGEDVRFVNYRDFSAEDRQVFINMLLGRDL